eukprot:gene6768-7566_t
MVSGTLSNACRLTWILRSNFTFAASYQSCFQSHWITFGQKSRRLIHCNQSLPRVGVACAVFDSNRLDDLHVLLVKRKHAPAKHLWSFPGGSLMFGETLAGGATREVMEETGIKVTTMGSVFKVVDGIFRGEDGRIEYHYVIINHLGLGTGTPIPCDDALAAQWLPVSRAPSMVSCHDGLSEALSDATKALTIFLSLNDNDKSCKSIRINSLNRY